MGQSLRNTGFSLLFVLIVLGCQSYTPPNQSKNTDSTEKNADALSETIIVPMEFSSGRSPYGSRSKTNYPYLLLDRPPRAVTTPPPGKSVHYGELIFLSSVKYLFAIALPADGNEIARLYLDLNRNGDFTDDTPEFYPGKGTRRTASDFFFQIPRPDGKNESYGIWLWNSLEADAMAVSNLVDPGYNYYANCHKTGTLSIKTDQGTQEIHIAVVDSIEYDATYDIESIMVDWNGNGEREDADDFPVGETRYFQGVHIRFVSVEPYADSLIFEIDYQKPARRNVLDVDADLALEPIVGNAPPPMGVKDTDGNLILLDDYKGKVVLIDFWATWCPPCREELPNVLDTYKRYHEDGFEIIGVSLDTNRENLVTFIKENEIPWRQIYDGKAWKGKVPLRYRVSGIPMPILVGRDGKIVSLQARGRSLPLLVESELSK